MELFVVHQAKVEDRADVSHIFQFERQVRRSMSEELFDVVNEDDEVVAQAPRPEVHARRLLHRAVQIFLLDSNGRLLLQKRSAIKDEFPLCYTSSASGHVDAGETYDEAAHRELAEELGLTGQLEFLNKFPACAETANEHTVLYRIFSDDEPIADPVEIESVEYKSLIQISEMMAENIEEFSPPFRVVFDWYVQSRQENHD